MNYRHAFHAGNHADVLKHVVLLAICDALGAKPAPCFALDTHAGRGLYLLDGDQARRTGEALEGVGRLGDGDGAPAPVRRYLDAVAACRERHGAGAYPGSPWLLAHALRAQDAIACCELHPEEATALRQALRGEQRVSVHERDGYAANAEPIIQLLRTIWDLNIVQPITIGPSQYGRLGLIAPDEAATPEEAATVLTFQDEAGKDLGALWLGKIYERSEGRPDPFGGGMATSEAGRYVKREGNNAVYLVGETFSEVKTDPTEWIDKTFFKVEKIKSIAIQTKEKENDWKLERSAESEDFTLANASAGEELDQAKVSSMKNAFSNAQFEDVFIGEAKEANPTGTSTATGPPSPTMPSALPMRSYLYASSGSSFLNVRATPSVMNINRIATVTKMTGRMTSRGGPLMVGSLKKMSSLPDTLMSIGARRMNATNAASTTGANGNSGRPPRPAQRKPRPMPRKLPSSTRFEK